MNHLTSSVLDTYYETLSDFFICCRLIRTFDALENTDIFSIFLSNGTHHEFEEDFIYDVARQESEALEIYHLLCQNNVTVCTLRDVLSDLLA